MLREGLLLALTNSFWASSRYDCEKFHKLRFGAV